MKDIMSCQKGAVTIVINIKIVTLVENMVYFSSGGESNTAYGWCVMYKYGRLQVGGGVFYS